MYLRGGKMLDNVVIIYIREKGNKGKRRGVFINK